MISGGLVSFVACTYGSDRDRYVVERDILVDDYVIACRRVVHLVAYVVEKDASFSHTRRLFTPLQLFELFGVEYLINNG